MTASTLADNFFRHEYSRIVAVLVRRFGSYRLELVEDAVQWALLQALRTWTVNDQPKNLSAWVYRVSMNRALDELRTVSRREGILLDMANEGIFPEWEVPEHELEKEILDDLLLMLFVTCHPEIPPESRIVLALKTLAGFSVSEIASHLFTSEPAIYKRLLRARETLKNFYPLVTDLTDIDLQARLPSVLTVIYSIFNEGYLSHQVDASIRNDLCLEAIRLATLLTEFPTTAAPQTFALLALLHLHSARISSRNDAAGGLLLLEEQDRDSWDQRQIQFGLQCLAASAKGDVLSRYHVESAIAAEHCLANSLANTNWKAISEYYEQLEQLAPSPVHRLNRAIAVSRWKGSKLAIDLLADRPEPNWFTSSYPWLAVQAMLLQDIGDFDSARELSERALAATPNMATKKLLSRRFKLLGIVENAGPNNLSSALSHNADG